MPGGPGQVEGDQARPAGHVQHPAAGADAGGQRYLDADRLAGAAAEAGFALVPALFDLDASALPTGLEETYRFLLGCGASRCKLDDAAEGVPEGVVVRSPDRSRIAKLRREDYERTLRRRQAGK